MGLIDRKSMRDACARAFLSRRSGSTDEYCSRKSDGSCDSCFWQRILAMNFWRRGRDLNPRHPMGELDFEILPDRQHRQPQTKIHSRKQLSSALAFVNFCQLLSVNLSQFFHSRERANGTSPSQIPKFSLTSNQAPLSKSSTLQMFFGTVRLLCKFLEHSSGAFPGTPNMNQSIR